MATVPASGTHIRLLTDIPFQNDYKHTRWFDTKEEQTKWFNDKVAVHTVMEQYNFQKIEGKNYIGINKNIDELWNVNYLMFRNAEYSSKWFYAFVTKVEYVRKQHTRIHFEIDVFQTWLFEMDFKPSYVVREHRPQWDGDLPVINTLDEGLDYGSEYDMVSVQRYRPTMEYKWMVIVCKAPLHMENPEIKPSYIGTAQPLTYYAFPFSDTGDKVTIESESTGAFTVIGSPTDILLKLYNLEEAQNNIVSIYVTDYIGVETEFNLLGAGDMDSIKLFDDSDGVTISPVSIYTDEGNDSDNLLMIEEMKEFKPMRSVTGDVYGGFEEVNETKLMMYPYCVIQLVDFRGNNIEYRPEYFKDKELEITVKGSLGTSNYVSYGFENYNISEVAEAFSVEVMDLLALVNNNPSDVPVVTDMLSSFLQGNRNSLLTQNETIDTTWQKQMVSGGINLIGAAASKNFAGVGQSATDMFYGHKMKQLELQQIQAKQADINNTPPTISKQGTNTNYYYGNGYEGVWIIKKQVKPEYRQKLENYFKMYGYKTLELKVPDFHTREHFNYIQTEGCTILAPINNQDLNELKSVFDNGITLWHTDEIGDYSLENGVIDDG